MTRLRELRLHGFKTFADPTRFAFGRGITAVIGPNGSGKSNMADAIRWVLGEQSNRSLRTRRADDVVFAGSQQRRPQGFAEAVLTLDNSDRWLPIDYGEVSIGRRAYRSGETEYLLNGAQVRLREIGQLLGEGRLGAADLVVVGQGTVDAALSLRAEERRQLFEEAAGVKSLQVRKNESLARLASARDNLTRVRDVIAELRPQVRRLEQQAAHQERHDRYRARLRTLVVESHRRRETDERLALAQAARRAAAAEAALHGFRATQEQAHQAMQTAASRYWEAEQAARVLAGDRERAREATIRAEARRDSLLAREAEANSSLAAAQRRMDEAAARLAAMSNTPEGTDLAAILERAAAAEVAWRDANARLAEADARARAASEALASDRRVRTEREAERWRHDEARRRNAARRDALEAELAELASVLAEERVAAERAAQARDAAATRRAAAESQLARATRSLADAEAAADRQAERVSHLERQTRAVRAELDATAARPAEGEGLAHRLASTGWRRLLDAVAIPQEAWPALEGLLGAPLDESLLHAGGDVDDALASAFGAANLLARMEGERDPGTARAMALEAVAGRGTVADWIAGPMDELPNVLHRTIVARDARALLEGWSRLPAGWGAVTIEGDVADARGVITLRGRRDRSSISRAQGEARLRERREALDRLLADRRSADRERAAGEATRAAAREALHAARSAFDEADREWRAASADTADRVAALGRLTVRLQRLRDELEAIRAAEAAGTQPADARSGDSDAVHRLEADDRSAQAELARATQTWEAAGRAWQDARLAVDRIETTLTAARADRTRWEGQLSEARAALQRGGDALATLRRDRQAAEDDLAVAMQDEQAATSARDAAEARRELLRRELLALEREDGGGSDRLTQLEAAAQDAAVEVSRREDALAAIRREQELALEDLPDADPGLEAGDVGTLSAEDLDRELRQLRRQLDQIGSVNPFAAAEHRELGARLADLITQETDLDMALRSTEALIGQLEGEINARFAAAFHAIGERFDEFARLLFAGGSASLHVGDGGDGERPGGIEIAVRPPGKRLQRLAMLSGGERALAGVALLFAMLSVNPVPFCVLDEVDAALDEANIGRFAEALRLLSTTTDFIVITHNRATIEMADTIYGVTMTDAAVSRVISLRLADLPVEAAV